MIFLHKEQKKIGEIYNEENVSSCSPDGSRNAIHFDGTGRRPLLQSEEGGEGEG